MKHRNKYMEEKFHSKKFSHSHRVSISFQCIRPEFRSVLLSFFLCGISLPYIYFYGMKGAKNKQTLHGNWCVFCNNVLKFYTYTMDSLDENEFCETNVKEGAKRTNDSL